MTFCEVCNTEYLTHRRGDKERKYCCERCANKAYRMRKRKAFEDMKTLVKVMELKHGH